MSECFEPVLLDTPLFLLGVLGGVMLHFIIHGVVAVLERYNSILQPLIMELCMLGNIRLRIFGFNLVLINPLLARQVRLRLKSL